MSARERLPCRDVPTLQPNEIRDIIMDKLLEKCFQMLLPEGTEFLREIEEFFEQVAGKQEEALEESKDPLDVTSRLWYTAPDLRSLLR